MHSSSPKHTFLIGIVNPRVIEAMKLGGVFLNVGRGHVVDEARLVAALCEGHLLGAVEDVFKEEPFLVALSFWDLKNVLIALPVTVTTPAYIRKAVAGFAENHRALQASGRLTTPGDVDAR